MDSSKEWTTLSKSEKEKLQHQSAEDGEFWSVTVRHRMGFSGYGIKCLLLLMPDGTFSQKYPEGVGTTL